MFINSINLKHVYNFGKKGTPELNGFKKMNLFIGKNGSGKSNIFRAFSELSVMSIDSVELKKRTYILLNESLSRHRVPKESINDLLSYQKGEIEIIINYNEKIVFKNDLLVEGSIDDLKRETAYLKQNNQEKLFYENLKGLDKDLRKSGLFSFCMYFIFRVDFSIRERTGITEMFTKQNESKHGISGSSTSNKIENWSSGYLSVANLLLQCFNINKSVICIDEPEVNLEPRVVRRLINILFWLFASQDEIQKEWNNWFDWYSLKEKEVWDNFTINKIIKPKQIFISSHSSIFIDEFIEKSSFCNIYEFDREYCDTSFNTGLHKSNQKTSMGFVRKVNAFPNSILDNLGAKGSDLLQTNGVVWVEGPSDVKYIWKWLEMYWTENNLKPLKKGKDFEFQMYGGTLLNSFYLFTQKNDKDSLKKLVSMFSFSRNAYIIIDSDAKLVNDVVVDKSKFKKAKKFIKQQVEEISSDNTGLWFSEGDTENTTIEDYLDKASLELFKSNQKLSSAIKITHSWSETKKLKDFKPELEVEIKKLYNKILFWAR